MISNSNFFMANAAPQTANNVINATQLFQNNSLQTPAEPAPAVNITITASLQRMRNACESWEQTAFATSNDMLYALLAECYDMDGKLDRAAARELTQYCDRQGIRYTKSTTPLAKIIKCVFGVDRRRVSTYVTALRAARQLRVRTADLTTWIKNAGGVQEVSMRRSANYMTASERASLASSVVLNQPVLATVSSPALSAMYKIDAADDTVLLVATRAADGSFEVRQLVQNGSAVKAAMSSCYSVASKQVAQQAVQVTATTQQEQMLSNAEELAAWKAGVAA